MHPACSHLNSSEHSEQMFKLKQPRLICASLAAKALYTIPFSFWIPATGTLANCENPDDILHNAAFHQGLHYLQW